MSVQSLNRALGQVPSLSRAARRVRMVAATSVLVVCAGFVAGCGNDVASIATTVPVLNALSGTATKGQLRGATVTVYRLGADGIRGTAIATSTTGADGSYTIRGDFAGPVAVVVTGGTYDDEATGEPVAMASDQELQTLLSSGADQTEIGVTPLTTVAAAQAVRNAGGGLARAISDSNVNVARTFGLEGVDIVRTRATDLSRAPSAAPATDDGLRYGLALAALTQVAKDNGLPPGRVVDLVKNIACDLSDGVIDGRQGDRGLDRVLTVTPEQAVNGLGVAAANFSGGERNRAGRLPEGVMLAPPRVPLVVRPGPSPSPAPPIDPSSTPAQPALPLVDQSAAVAAREASIQPLSPGVGLPELPPPSDP